MIKRICQFALLGVLLTIAATTSGCAFGDRKIALVYQPISTKMVDNQEQVSVASFNDLREDKIVVGEVRNGYGMKTAKVLIENQDAGVWVANALCSELENAGFTVDKISDPINAQSSFLITGSIQELYTKMYMSYNCKVRVKINVSKEGIPLLSKEYVGNAKAGAFAMTPGEYESVAKSALQDVMKQSLKDIVEAIQ